MSQTHQEQLDNTSAQDPLGNAPRITVDDLKNAIQEVHYFTAGDGFVGAMVHNNDLMATMPTDDNGTPIIEAPETLELMTFCIVVLKNGWKVVGQSACVSPENFNAEYGQSLAHKNAMDQIWPLLGFNLAQQLHDEKSQLN